jgi:hypothetical protein
MNRLTQARAKSGWARGLIQNPARKRASRTAAARRRQRRIVQAQGERGDRHQQHHADGEVARGLADQQPADQDRPGHGADRMAQAEEGRHPALLGVGHPVGQHRQQGREQQVEGHLEADDPAISWTGRGPS